MDSESSKTSINNLKLLNKSNGEEESWYAYSYQLSAACAVPMVMKATIKIGVLQIIHDHGAVDGVSPLEIATRLKIRNPNAPEMLDRMLRLLASYSVVTCTVVPAVDGRVAARRRYSPSPVTKFFVPDQDGVSLAAGLNLFNDKVFLESWSKLDEAVLEGGIPFNMVHGMHAFEYPRVDPRFNHVFNQAMNQATTFSIKKILENYNGFENIQQLVDVGGGLGHTLELITSKYPSIKGINFDLPHVIQNALPITGVEHVSRDMFEAIPKGDVISLKWILHNWSDEHCLKLLKNCHKVLPKEGKVIVVEVIMEDEALSNDSSRAINHLDVLMMTQHVGGKERSRHEFESLANAAGFSNFNIVCYVYNYWVMEFYK